jgi:hypothetical protein
MARKKPSLDELVEQVTLAPGAEKKRLIGKATSQVLPGKPQKKIGRPTKYNPKIADEVLSRIAGGQTLPKITKELGVSVQNIYDWMDKDQNFLDQYNRARERQAKTLVDSLIEESEQLENDRALAVRTRADIVRWVAARFAPSQFGDVKRIELKGEVNHTHTHELAQEQKRRIAEAWLISQQDEPGTLIEGETVPDIEPGVQVIQDEQQREIPKRKRVTVKPKSPGAQDEQGRWVGRKDKEL